MSKTSIIVIGRFFDVPESLFNTCLVGLIAIIVASKLSIRWFRRRRASPTEEHIKPLWAKSIQFRFLPVFWLVRIAFWMSGPYFYAVYASKTINGEQASTSLISQIFLVGFAAIALIGPMTGRAFDEYGRKKGTIAATIVYSFGAISTKASSAGLLFLGRGLGGIGTSMLSNAPESWRVSEFQSTGLDDGRWLYDTFGLAFSGDYVAAIIAGQIAGHAAAYRGPTGPFEVSPFFLATGALVATIFWKENKASSNYSSGSNNISPSVAPSTEDGNTNAVANPNEAAESKRTDPQGELNIEEDDASTDSDSSEDGSIQDALRIVLKDPKIMFVGAIQALFESSMYVFVMQWPPTLAIEIQQFYRDETVATPYGTVFSCFMACCLIGSTVFSQMAIMGIKTRKSMTVMLPVASLSLALATYAIWSKESTNKNHLVSLVAAFFTFEACVGMYFPSIGSLRSQYIPDSHRGLIMTLFGVPLNILVVVVFLFLHKLGSTGALGLSTVALSLASFCMYELNKFVEEEARREQEERRRKSKLRWGKIATAVRTGTWVPLYMQESRSNFVSMQGYGVQMSFKSPSASKKKL